MAKTKKTTTKARTTRRNTTPAPPLTDARLVALLSFITNGDIHNDSDGRLADSFANSARSAWTMLTSQPVTSAFGLNIGRPTVYEEVSQCLAADICHWTDPKDSRRAFDTIEAARKQESDDALNPADVNQMLDAYMDHSLLLGACLMYALLNGGAR